MDRTIGYLQKFQKSITELVYPSWCLGCQLVIVSGYELCVDCFKSIRAVGSMELVITHQMSMPVHALGNYSGALKVLIHQKFVTQDLAARVLGNLMTQHVLWEKNHFDVLVPVPLHWTRYAARGYNQSVEMSKVIQQKKQLASALLVRRTKKTIFQHQLSREKRKSNINAVFGLYPWIRFFQERYYYKHFLLIDDLCTTGATLTACAQALLPLKPASITALVVARAV